jgi:uncharacterized membrane protein YkoI
MMSDATSQAGGRSPAKKKKKKPPPNKQSSLLSYKKDKHKFNEVLTRTYVGKRILLTSQYLYGRRVPEGEEDLLFQYHVSSINDDNATATIDYDNKCIRDGHHEFQSYPDPQDDIPNYDLKTFKDDHELFLKHLGRGQKILNDVEFARKKREREEAEALAAANADMSDISDLELKVEEGVEIYELMMGEFEPAGDLCLHTIRRGAKEEGKTIKKQLWSE